MLQEKINELIVIIEKDLQDRIVEKNPDLEHIQKMINLKKILEDFQPLRPQATKGEPVYTGSHYAFDFFKNGNFLEKVGEGKNGSYTHRCPVEIMLRTLRILKSNNKPLNFKELSNKLEKDGGDSVKDYQSRTALNFLDWGQFIEINGHQYKVKDNVSESDVKKRFESLQVKKS